MLQRFPEHRLIQHKSQRQSPVNSIRHLQPSNRKDFTPNHIVNFKKQMLNKLKPDTFFPLRLETQIPVPLKKRQLSSRKRLNTEDNQHQKYLFPELVAKNKQYSFKYDVDSIKIQSKRMLQRVNKLYEIVKSDIDQKQIKHKKYTNKILLENPQTEPKRHRTIDKVSLIAKPFTMNIMSRRKSTTQHTKRASHNRKAPQLSPQSGLLFTFYPNQQEVNQFLQ